MRKTFIYGLYAKIYSPFHKGYRKTNFNLTIKLKATNYVKILP